jgi:hypothetical protein
MKKVLLIAAAALISASAIAQVTSANIVGYSKKAVTDGSFSILAPQFVVENTNGIALKNAFTGLADETLVYAWDGGYTTYYYFDGLWYDVDDFYSAADDDIIPAGASVWLKSTADTNVLMSGEVPQVDSVTNVIGSGFSLVANPYPVDLVLSNIPQDNLPAETLVYAWDGGYTTYYYFDGLWYDVDDFYSAADGDVISVGDGFWIKNPTSSFELIFDKQY